MAISKESIGALMKALAPVIHEHVEKIAQPLRQRIAELEAKPFLREAGTWDAKTGYGIGAVVSDHGSAWVCKHPTTERPGESAHWRLLVKRGRDSPTMTALPLASSRRGQCQQMKSDAC
jgi:hypothetical protein